MSNFVIVTDSAADLPRSFYREHGVECVPLGFTMDGVTYGGDDGAYMDEKTFFAKVRAGSMPKTFQITPDVARKHMEPYLLDGKDLLVIPFSSGLSGTAENFAHAAAALREAYPERQIEVVDSLCASLGLGLLLHYVAKMAESGASLAETANFVQENKLHICHYFTVDDLYHLKRGGRVSGAAAVIGSLLHIKPILHVDDEGHLIPIAKAIGRKKSLSIMVDKLKALKDLRDDDPIFISHGDCIEDVEYLKQLIISAIGERKIYVHTLGTVIGAHTGAGLVAMFFRGTHR